MQRLGRVISVTPAQNLVVKAEQTPKMGLCVVDENLKTVGNVFDVIGPVTSPYAIIRTMVKEPLKLAGKQLYLLPSKKVRDRDR